MDKKPMIMIGLLGDKPKMAEKKEGGLLESDVESCPLATQNETINTGNKEKAIVVAKYGKRTDAQCKSCEYFCTPDEMPNCGIKNGMGFCKVYEFMCAESNGCDSWESADMEEAEEMEDEGEYDE